MKSCGIPGIDKEFSIIVSSIWKASRKANVSVHILLFTNLYSVAGKSVVSLVVTIFENIWNGGQGKIGYFYYQSGNSQGLLIYVLSMNPEIISYKCM